MKFHRDVAVGVNLVRAWAPGSMTINDTKFESSVIVSAGALVPDWPVERVEDISMDTLRAALALEPDIVVIGTGPDHCLPNMALVATLQAQGIGVEVMATVAAVRTYNILVGEDRRVVAALLVP